MTTFSYYLRRVARAEVTAVHVRTLRSWRFWILRGVLFVLGLASAAFLARPFITGEHNLFRVVTASGLAMSLCAGGLILPPAVRGRLGLVISLAQGQFRWAPPLIIDPASKKCAEEFLDRIFLACQKAGLRVVDERRAW